MHDGLMHSVQGKKLYSAPNDMVRYGTGVSWRLVS